MRLLRVPLAVLLASGPVQAQPVVDLISRWSVQTDQAAASAPEGEAPQGSGKKLAALEADLSLVSEGLEAFAHPQDADKALLAAKPRLPAGTELFFRDRTTALNALYRTLAVVDYTWALRFPNPPCAPASERWALLQSDDGLFTDPSTGETSDWMTALLGPSSKGKKLESILDQAALKASPSQAEYSRLRARLNHLTKALAAEDAGGETRARLYCDRAETKLKLAAANHFSGPVEAARAIGAEPSHQGLVLLAAKTSDGLEVRGAGVVFETKSGLRVLTDRRLGEGELVALVDGKKSPVPLSVEREDSNSGLLLLNPSGDIGRALPLANAVPKENDLVLTFAHSDRLGAWTMTQGLVTNSDASQFQTDAVSDASMAGGAVLDEEGRVAGLLVLRRAGTLDWPIAVPAPALSAWLSGGEAPVAEPVTLSDAGTTKILTASRSLLESVRVGEGATSAGYGFETQTQWGTVHAKCMANCGDSSPHSSYSSNGGKELGDALGAMAAVGIEALIYKGIPALFRGIGSLFKSRQAVVAPRPRPSAQVAVQEMPPEPPKINCQLSKVAAPATVGMDPVELKVRFSCDDQSAEQKVPLGGHRVTFTLGWDDLAPDYRNLQTVTDDQGYASISFYLQNPRENSERSHRDLDKHDPDKKRPVAQEAAPPEDGALINTARTGAATEVVAETVAATKVGQVYRLPGIGKNVRSVASLSLRKVSTTAGVVTLGEITVTGAAAYSIIVTGGLSVAFTVNYGLNRMITEQGKYNDSIDTRRDDKPRPKQSSFNPLDEEALASSDGRQSEYEAYKKRCGEAPPTGLDVCAELLWRMQREKDCVRMREDWDKKWDGDHADEIASRRRAMENIQRQLRANRCL